MREFKPITLKDLGVDEKLLQSLHLTKEQESILSTYGKIQEETMAIDMLSGQYALGTNKQYYANQIVKHAELLLESAKKLANIKQEEK